jgi:hypothetical protein
LKRKENIVVVGGNLSKLGEMLLRKSAILDSERLEELDLLTLKYRRISGDIIELKV